MLSHLVIYACGSLLSGGHKQSLKYGKRPRTCLASLGTRPSMLSNSRRRPARCTVVDVGESPWWPQPWTSVPRKQRDVCSGALFTGFTESLPTWPITGSGESDPRHGRSTLGQRAEPKPSLRLTLGGVKERHYTGSAVWIST